MSANLNATLALINKKWLKIEHFIKTQEELIYHKLPGSLADNTVGALFHSYESISLCCISLYGTISQCFLRAVQVGSQTVLDL